MVEYLLDTNAISAFAPNRAGMRTASQAFEDWLIDNRANAYLSSITIFEIESGLQKLGRLSPGQFHLRMAEWVETMLLQFSGRTLSIDDAIGRRAGRLADFNAANGRNPGTPDLPIAATALHHDMVLVTRNAKDFSIGGLRLLDPHQAFSE